jgi:hypothetical protein
MRAKIILFIAASVTLTAIGTTILPFQGWEWLKGNSPDIIIARCTRIPRPGTMMNGVSADIEVLSVLKGTNGPGPATLDSVYWPRQGEDYLIFGNYHAGHCQAIEDYRFVPLGANFSLDRIAGKPLGEQLQIMFKFRLWYLGRELEQGQQEKKRLEEGVER